MVLIKMKKLNYINKNKHFSKKSIPALITIGVMTIGSIPASAFAEQSAELADSTQLVSNTNISLIENGSADDQNKESQNSRTSSNVQETSNTVNNTGAAVNNTENISDSTNYTEDDSDKHEQLPQDTQNASANQEQQDNQFMQMQYTNDSNQQTGQTKGAITSADNGNGDLFWSDSQAPQMYGTCEATIPVGENFSTTDARFRVFARDFEDGDVTSNIRVLSGASIDTSVPGTYYVSYAVTDSNGNTSEFITKINVVSGTNEISLTKTAYQNASAWNLQRQGIHRGDHQDRQILGVWIPAGQSVNFEYLGGGSHGQKLTLSLPTSDTGTDGIGGDVSAGETLTLKASDSSGTIPTLKTPMNSQQDKAMQHPIKYRVTYATSTGIAPAHYWHYGDNEDSFLSSWRNDNAQPFSFIEGNSIAIIVPFSDRNQIFGSRANDHFHKTLSSWCAYWDKIMDKDDSMVGVSVRASDPIDQRVRTKYFVRPNVHGAGGAYYASGDHVGIHSASDYSFFEMNWGGLHEVGHGYQGALRGSSMSLGETSNNVYGYATQHDSSIYPYKNYWLNYNASADNANKLSHTVDRFDSIGASNMLYVLLSLSTLSGESVEQFNANLYTYARHAIIKTGTTLDNAEYITRYFADKHNIDVTPYLEYFKVNIPQTALDYVDKRDDLTLAVSPRDVLGKEKGEAIKAMFGTPNAWDPIKSSMLIGHGNGSLLVKINADNDVIERIEGRYVMLVDSDKANGKKTIARARIHNGTVDMSNVPVGNWRIIAPDASTDDEAVTCSAPRYVKITDRESTSVDLSYKSLCVTAKSSFEIRGIFGTVGFRGTVQPGEGVMNVDLGGSNLGNQGDPESTIWSYVIARDDRGKELARWEVNGGNHYYSDIADAKKQVDMKPGYTIEIHNGNNRVDYQRVSFFGENGAKIDADSMSSNTETYVMTSQGFEKKSSSSATTGKKLQEDYAVAALKGIMDSMSDAVLNDPRLGHYDKALVSRYASCINSNDFTSEMHDFVNTCRNSGWVKASCEQNDIRIDKHGELSFEQVISGVNALMSDDRSLKLSRNNTSIEINGKEVTDEELDKLQNGEYPVMIHIKSLENASAIVERTIHVKYIEDNKDNNSNTSNDNSNNGNNNSAASNSEINGNNNRNESNNASNKRQDNNETSNESSNVAQNGYVSNDSCNETSPSDSNGSQISENKDHTISKTGETAGVTAGIIASLAALITAVSLLISRRRKK